MQSTAICTRPARRRALTVGIATAAGLVHWALAGPVTGADLAVRAGGAERQVGPFAVVVSSLLAGLAAWGLLALLERTVARPVLVWTIVAAVVLVVSLAGPWGSAVGTGTLLSLVGMHLTVGAALILGLGRSVRPQEIC